VIIEQIELKYCNKIILNVGLGVAFYDFVNIGDPYLYPGAGSAIQVVRFRLIVFRPFVGEVMSGKVIQSTKEGLRISLEFFDDIFIPSSQLQNPSIYNPDTSLWTWKYDGSLDSENEFVLELGDEVRPIHNSLLSNRGVIMTISCGWNRCDSKYGQLVSQN
jgi:DNA-directed RNA polymerase III subunit RPC8